MPGKRENAQSVNLWCFCRRRGGLTRELLSNEKIQSPGGGLMHVTSFYQAPALAPNRCLRLPVLAPVASSSSLYALEAVAPGAWLPEGTCRPRPSQGTCNSHSLGCAPFSPVYMYHPVTLSISALFPLE